MKKMIASIAILFFTAVSAMADSADAVGTLARFRVRRGTATRAGGTRL